MAKEKNESLNPAEQAFKAETRDKGFSQLNHIFTTYTRAKKELTFEITRENKNCSPGYIVVDESQDFSHLPLHKTLDKALETRQIYNCLERPSSHQSLFDRNRRHAARPFCQSEETNTENSSLSLNGTNKLP